MIYDQILPLALGGGGLLFIFCGLIIWHKVKESCKWPKVEGEIVSSEVVSGLNPPYKGNITCIAEPGIRYKYAVDGKEYEHNKVAFFHIQNTSSADAQKVTDKYPKGAKVTVYYNPQNPQEALLELESPRHMLIIAGVGVIMVLVAPILFFLT